MVERKASLARHGVFIACVYLAGCASSTNGDPPPDPPPPDLTANPSDLGPPDMSKPTDMSGVSEAQACSDYATAFCTKLQNCYSGYLQAAYGDLATCNTRKQMACTSRYFTAPGTSLTPTRWKDCAQAISTETCTQFNSLKPATGCEVLPGTLAKDAACLFDDQCSTARCKKAAGTTCGSCVNIVPTGGTCSSDHDCADSESCSGSKCVAVVGSGATCDTTHACDTGFHCSTGTCVANVALNGACMASTDCAYYLTCISNVCKSGGFAASGSACGYVTSNTPWVYCTKGTCKLDSSGTKGTCVGDAADSAACGSATSTGCTPPAECISSTCKILDPMSCM